MVSDTSRGTGGEPVPMSQMRLELEALCRRGMETAASETAIERFERSVRESAEREARERYAEAAREARKMFPLRRGHQDAIVRHCAPGRTAPALERTAALTSVAAWPRLHERDGRSVLALIGKMGNGKTTAAMVAALRAFQAGETVAYVKETTLLRWRKFVSMAPMLERAMSVGLLVIDELGTKRKDAEEASEAILEIVDDRLGVGRTMLIGNVTREEFSTRYDARLIDRMREVGIITECLADSMRGREAA